jgi:hypothetical protein
MTNNSLVRVPIIKHQPFHYRASKGVIDCEALASSQYLYLLNRTGCTAEQASFIISIKSRKEFYSTRTIFDNQDDCIRAMYVPRDALQFIRHPYTLDEFKRRRNVSFYDAKYRLFDPKIPIG